MDDQITHNACPICKIRCHCHYCHTAALTDLKRLEEAKIDLDALLALYRDQQKELESIERKCERLQIERDAVVENRDLTAEERDEARAAARVYRMALRGDPAAAAIAALEMEENLDWLKEKV